MKENKDILAKAIEQLKNQQIPPDPPQELVESTLKKIEDKTDSSEGQNNKHISLVEIITNKKNALLLTTKIAAVAALLILSGYVIGRLSIPRTPDLQELQRNLESSLTASLEPAIRQKILEEMNQRWQLALASSYLNLKDELNEQYRKDLNDYALRTLAASNAMTNRRLEELIDAISTAQLQDRRWVTAALSEIELNRRQDKTQLASGLEALAYQTEDQLQRTRQDMVQLLADTQPDKSILKNPESSN
jgi:HEPN domain-containing protein